MAGFDLGLLPIGDWSIFITLSSWSYPIIWSCFPALTLLRFNLLESFLYNISFTNELFPEPDTPVTQVMTPSGKSTSICLRLFSYAFLTVSHPVGFLRSAGTSIFFLPLKYAPVMEFSHFIISSAVPSAMTYPPFSPASGPISIMWSAARMVSSSCSTTIRVFPRSLNSQRAAISLSLSL